MSSALRRAVNAARCQSRAERGVARARATGGTGKQEFLKRYIDAELSRFCYVCLHRGVPT